MCLWIWVSLPPAVVPFSLLQVTWMGRTVTCQFLQEGPHIFVDIASILSACGKLWRITVIVLSSRLVKGNIGISTLSKRCWTVSARWGSSCLSVALPSPSPSLTAPYDTLTVPSTTSQFRHWHLMIDICDRCHSEMKGSWETDSLIKERLLNEMQGENEMWRWGVKLETVVGMYFPGKILSLGCP